MINVSSLTSLDIENIGIDTVWNFSDTRELKMHSIHAYPAKFPAFIAEKAIAYARSEGVRIKSVSDIFCGCGTVALEAKLHGLDFWGCDINPVATLIAKAKSNSYKISTLNKYFLQIAEYIKLLKISTDVFAASNERLVYWFDENSFIELYALKQTIDNVVPRGKYKEAFLCIFSSILKPASKWLTKSIKPQVDPNKLPINVFDTFSQQFERFIKAVNELDEGLHCRIIIDNANFLTKKKVQKADLIITSPPYVTSYEYADLHQLSALWLNYANDYRELRCGSIGSVYNSEAYSFNLTDLNGVGNLIVQQLWEKNGLTAHVKSVARYYLDMQVAIKKCADSLNENGMIFCVVGDTEYKGVRIENSKHLTECLITNKFQDIKISKRRVSNKLLTPYRDTFGRFSSDDSQRKVYHEEFVVSGRR